MFVAIKKQDNLIVSFDIETKIDQENPENFIPVCIGYTNIYWDSGELYVESYSSLAPYQDQELLKLWCREQLAKLHLHIQCGNTVLGWNSVGFDLKVLGTVAEALPLAASIAFESVDLLLNFMTIKGYPIGLEACSQGFGLSGKLKTDTGEEIRKDIDSLLISDEGIDLLLQYVEQDTILTFEVYSNIVRSGNYRWIAKSGTRNRVSHRGIHNSFYCLQLPEIKLGFNPPTTISKLSEWLKPFMVGVDYT